MSPKLIYKLLCVVLLSCCFKFLSAQSNVNRIEYFVDIDPGYGNATSLAAVPSTNLTDLTLPLDVTVLSPGVHQLFVRAQNADGSWSLTNRWLFYKPYDAFGSLPPPADIQIIEYTVDNNPAVTMPLSQGANISDLIIPVNPSSLNEGVHQFFVRAKDADGKWSLLNRWMFYKPSPPPSQPALPKIIQLEYFIDTDPGLGMGTQVPISHTTNIADLIVPLNMERISPCSHKLYVRVKDSTGAWSMINSYSFNNTYIGPTATPQDFMLQFDGQNDYLDLGTWFNQQKFTLSFWVRPDSVQSNGAAIAAIQNDLYLYSNPNVRNNYVLAHLLQFDLLPNDWNHITITVDGATNTRKVYLFGQLIDENHWNYVPQNGFNLRFGNGGFFPNAYFKGSLDEIKLWNKVLSPDSIYLNVAKPLQGNEVGLLGYWNFNNGCDTFAVDITGNSHTAILKNGLGKRLSTVPSIGEHIIPKKGGQNRITVKIYGKLFKSGAVAKLTKNGFADIMADTTVITESGSIATCIFNLIGKDTGLYNIVISNPDTTTKFYANSFTIEPLDTTARITIQMLGSNVFRRGRIYKFFIVYQNTSNVDVPALGFVLKSFGRNYIAFAKEDLIYKWQTLPILLGNRTADDPYNGFSSSDSVLSPGAVYSIPIYALDSSQNGSRINGLTSTTLCDELESYVLEGAFANRPDFDGSTGSGDIPVKPMINTGHNYIDGCSNPAFIVDLINIPFGWGTSNENWNDVFFPACANHDLCYQTCYEKYPGQRPNLRAREICDIEFHKNMYRICENWVGNKDDCKAAAMAYYKGVRAFGRGAFADNQFYCTGGIRQPPIPQSSGSYMVPDCNCKTAEICYRPKRIGSFDPNEKIGPATFQKSLSNFNYLINFENLSTATAPAQEVTVIDTIDKTKFDISTFNFGLFGFADTVSSAVQPLAKSFSQQIDLRPAKDMIVKVDGRIDTTSGVAYWKFLSLDPSTMLLTEDPLAGFLPPSDSVSNRGKGWVTFSIKPYDTLPTGAELKNKATIIFDFNAPIITNEPVNRIDNILPQSKMFTLASTQPDSNFVVRWKGSDSIAGVRHYSIYVSENYGAFNLWRVNLSDTFATYQGGKGHQYRFYSIATDSAGNIELQKTMGEAATLVTLSLSDSICAGDNVSFPSGQESPATAYQWQVNSAQGFVNLSPGAVYSQVMSDVLVLTAPPTSFSGNLYRCLITNGSQLDTSKTYELRFVNTWMGYVSSEWENPSNWSCGVVPDQYTDIIIPATESPSPVLNSNGTGRSLNITSGAILNIKPGYNLYLSGRGFW